MKKDKGDWGQYTLVHSECLEYLKTMPDNCVDAIVTDPPAGIGFMNKDWDKNKGGRDNWIVWMQEIAVECLRVIKPGGHALVWQLPRTSHWTAMAWENAGFELQDRICHVFSTGFPKNIDISKQLDKKAGAEREVIGKRWETNRRPNTQNSTDYGKYAPDDGLLTTPATEEAKEWDGFGTALKPSVEDWILFRKPIERGLTIAQNCVKWGVGALDIDRCRVSIDTTDAIYAKNPHTIGGIVDGNVYGKGKSTNYKVPEGRWPSHLIHDGSDEVVGLFPKSTGCQPHKLTSKKEAYDGYGSITQKSGGIVGYTGEGSAARFFQSCPPDVDQFRLIYQPKPSPSERNKGCKGLQQHPTMKSIALMEYLIKLVSREGQVVLDPFVGTGTTIIAARNLKRICIGIEMEEESIVIAKARIKAHKQMPKLF